MYRNIFTKEIQPLSHWIRYGYSKNSPYLEEVFEEDFV